MLSEFVPGYYITEATKNVCCQKGTVVIDHIMFTSSSRLKTVEFKAVFGATEANLVGSIRRV